jgi:hypothetical protein
MMDKVINVTIFSRLLKKASLAVIARSMSDEAIP